MGRGNRYEATDFSGEGWPFHGDLRKLIEDKKKTGHILKVLRTGHMDKLCIESVDFDEVLEGKE